MASRNWVPSFFFPLQTPEEVSSNLVRWVGGRAEDLRWETNVNNSTDRFGDKNCELTWKSRNYFTFSLSLVTGASLVSFSFLIPDPMPGSSFSSSSISSTCEQKVKKDYLERDRPTFLPVSDKTTTQAEQAGGSSGGHIIPDSREVAIKSLLIPIPREINSSDVPSHPHTEEEVEKGRMRWRCKFQTGGWVRYQRPA